MAGVSFDGVTKRYGSVTAVDHLDLRIDDGELLVLLGPSGCGKTTALRMVAGLEDISEGRLSIGDRVVNDVDARERDVAMVFQSYALYPHLTVAANIEFPLRQRKLGKAERSERALAAAKTLGLDELVGRKPGQLSGGQRQRVALARAIVREPQVFLMDEPLSNLDAALRLQTRADIVALQHRLGTTTVYVTHDQVEAMTMAHRIAVMLAGELQQLAPPKELYERPATTFVARFLGSPGMNIVDGTLERATGDELTVATHGGRVTVGRAARELAGEPARDVSLGIRPEDLYLVADGADGADGVHVAGAAAEGATGVLAGTVTLVEVLGADVHVVCEVPGDQTVVVRQAASLPMPGLGTAVKIGVAGHPHLFDRDGGQRLEVIA